MAFIKKLVPYMTNEEKEQMKKWTAKEQDEWRKWVRQENFLRMEHHDFTHHRQPCDCFNCRVYRQRIRIKCQRPVKRFAK